MDRLIMGLGSAIFIVLVLTLPVAYFFIEWNSRDTQLRTEAKIYARDVSAIIARNPDMWVYETDRLEGIISNHPGDMPLTRHRILKPDGGIVAQYSEDVPQPIMTRSHPLRDAGLVVGSVEVSMSLRPLITDTSVLAAGPRFSAWWESSCFAGTRFPLFEAPLTSCRGKGNGRRSPSIRSRKGSSAWAPGIGSP